ncbi:MAG TPA: GspE/PulE family protein [Tepidisphaeraceae bacterium]|nr:GspE/PulE family protein [Tepidisphaeraceae bacterium]
MDIVATLNEQGLLSDAAALQVRELTRSGRPLDDALLEGAATENGEGAVGERVLRYFSEQFQMPFVDMERVAPSKELLAKFPVRLLLQHRLLPVEDAGDAVLIATSKVFDTSALDELRIATGLEVRPVLAPASEIDRATKRLLGVGADTLQSMNAADDGVKVIEEEDNLDLSDTAAAQDASIIKFVNQILGEALESRATDVHIEPFENQLRVRYRIDGVLQEANIPTNVRKFHAAIVSRIKILSHLDIAEKRLPQDGRIRLRVNGREIDLRVSVIPMIHGEAVVMRILDRGDAVLGLEHLGMSARDRGVWDRVLDLPHGIILVTGPTGSGKTTSLYAALSKINQTDLKIITIEDPVEYQMRGINQIQISTKTGLTFASGLRAILRHDPDVVLIGEIRDRETAEIAVQASLTGHLVFSTLHTNDAPGATTRLIDMGIEPYLVASSLEMVLAQRLVRLICKECKDELPREEMEKLRAEFGNDVPAVVYKGRGCRQCQNTGYRGRQGLFEMMPVTEDVRTLILERASSGTIRKVAIRQGMNSLRGDGWRLIQEGRTTVEEVIRMTKDETRAVGADADGMATK